MCYPFINFREMYYTLFLIQLPRIGKNQIEIHLKNLFIHLLYRNIFFKETKQYDV